MIKYFVYACCIVGMISTAANKHYSATVWAFNALFYAHCFYKLKEKNEEL